MYVIIYIKLISEQYKYEPLSNFWHLNVPVSRVGTIFVFVVDLDAATPDLNNIYWQNNIQINGIL